MRRESSATGVRVSGLPAGLGAVRPASLTRVPLLQPLRSPPRPLAPSVFCFLTSFHH